VETRLVQCANCGAELDLGTGACPYCSPAVPGTAPKREARAAASPPALDERALGLALFEAEECLARGSPDKALVLASKAVKDRPDSLTARALLERARRELLRGRRRERLEARVQDAGRFVDKGDLDGAERIVVSALKLIPDHTLALGLFARIKQQRLGAGTAEAEALRELERLAHAQARKALETARAALAGGWERRAFFALRQGLRHAPGDPELLALLREAQKSLERLDLVRARRHALTAQVRAGLDLLAQGQLEESLRILRAVLREDPDNSRAQTAVRQVRQVWLTRAEFASATGRAVAAAEPPPRQAPREPPQPLSDEAPTPPPAAATVAAPPQPAPRPLRPPARARAAPALESDLSRIPVEIRLPATRRRATPVTWVVAGGVGIAAIMAWIVLGGRAVPTPSTAVPPETTQAAGGTSVADSGTQPGPPASEEGPGPWSGVAPDLRAATESRLASYAQALERADDALLASARPDLSPEQRRRALAPFRNALNAATDLRVLQVATLGDAAEVVVLRSDFIVGRPPTPPLEETLRFRRTGGRWVLR